MRSRRASARYIGLRAALARRPQLPAASPQVAEIDPSFDPQMYGHSVNPRPHAIPSLAAAVLLLAAVGAHPYAYYTFLRWAVFLAAVIVAWVAWGSRLRAATWVFLGIAVLFNPVAPVYLDRSSWQLIDVTCAGLFALSLIITRESAVEPRDRETMYK